MLPSASIAKIAAELSLASEHLRATWRRELGISAYEMLAISHVAEAGPLTIGELGSRLALSSGAMTGLLDRLERAKLVLRVRDEHDRRRVQLVVTDQARTQLDHLAAPLFERLDRLSIQFRADGTNGAEVLGAVLDCYAATLKELR
jgi:DNA-binding MarR family transcriptional regulator